MEGAEYVLHDIGPFGRRVVWVFWGFRLALMVEEDNIGTDAVPPADAAGTNPGDRAGCVNLTLVVSFVPCFR